MITIGEIDRKLEILREKWKTAPMSMRPIILRQARALKIARKKLEKQLTFPY